MWAPDISFRNGKFWLYYAVSSSGSQSSAIGLATKASLASGAWEDQGMVITSKAYGVNDNAIDPNAVTDVQGNPWLCWGSWWDGIFIVRLDPETGKPLAGAAPTNLAKRGGGIEGAFIVYARGYYHLFTSWDKCCAGTSSTYNMRYGRATAVIGPYVDKAGKDLASGGGTLLSDGSDSPGGHNGIMVDNGNYYIVYHVYDGRNNPASLQIRHLFFDAQNWPTVEPAAAPVARPPNRARPDVPGIGTDWSAWFEMLLGRKSQSRSIHTQSQSVR
jgi:arabinan endo-1,5-alpha-L-arabinosidase